MQQHNRLGCLRPKLTLAKPQPTELDKGARARARRAWAILCPVPSARRELRNVAVIAHVDHGKTSLVNSMLAQAGLVHVKFGEGGFTLDSMTGNPLEREKGVTILTVTTQSPLRALAGGCPRLPNAARVRLSEVVRSEQGDWASKRYSLGSKIHDNVNKLAE